MHIYAFGSVCRGEVSPNSDVDLLALVEGTDRRFDPNIYSIYSYKRIEALWREGNPFAWHLSLEARMLFASDRVDCLGSLGTPERYSNGLADCEKFHRLFSESQDSIKRSGASVIFDLSTIFLSIRNIATCFSLSTGSNPDFSRKSALNLGSYSVPLPSIAFQTLERARMLCTRGLGKIVSAQEATLAMSYSDEIDKWMSRLVEQVKSHE